MITKSDWQNVHQRLMDEGRRKASDPPTAGEMLAYTRGELSPDEEDRIRELLVHYPELARLAAEPFPAQGAEPGDADYMSEHELARHWTSMQGRVAKRGKGRILQFWRASAALAAAVMVLLGGLLWKAQSDLRAPRAGWELVLLPEGQRGPAGDAVVLPGKGDFYSLVAVVGEGPRFDEYRVEIIDAGKKVWEQTLPGREDGASLTILVPRRSLKPGKYQVVLIGVDGGGEQPVASYAVRVPRQ
jgi:hypothetical protein